MHKTETGRKGYSAVAAKMARVSYGLIESGVSIGT